MASSYRQGSPAPSLGDMESAWINSPGVTLAALRGRLVILDFWTFCCINCIHVADTLKDIEASFPTEVVVVGVHSPKFAAERDVNKVAAAVARYDIHHPVLLDPDMKVWRSYNIRSWPTLVFISPAGAEIGRLSGEPDLAGLKEDINQLLVQWRATGEIVPDSLPHQTPPERINRLSFPGKIKAAPGQGGGWVFADSGNNQIVLVEQSGREAARFGGGCKGWSDGPGKTALFSGPQGLVATADAIYVADTGNHALRRIDRLTGEVETLAGLGFRGGYLGQPTAGRTTALASPWDVEFINGSLVFANAGTHQLGIYDVSTGEVSRLAGTGAESIDDGPAARSTLAQPSGLALSREDLVIYFVDSETSAVRQIDLNGTKNVHTLVGTGLFDFGHRNGKWSDALLQHPLGLSLEGHRLAVADSYNDTIRLLDLEHETVTDLDSGEFLCVDPVCMPMSEPAGVCFDGNDRLLVADTNNHRILAFDLVKRCYSTFIS